MDHIPVYKIVGVLPKILFIDIITRGFIWTISFSPVQSRATRTFIWGSGDLKDCNFQNSIWASDCRFSLSNAGQLG